MAVFSSFLNPLNIVKVSPEQIPQYNSRWVDDYFWMNRLNQYQQFAPKYAQPWQNNDVISLQLQGNSGQINIEVKNCKGKTVQGFIMTPKQQDSFEPSKFIYEANIAQTPFIPEGVYYYVFKVGVAPIVDVLIADPVYIAQKHPRTLLIQYKNRKFKQKFIFETGIEPSIRVRGYLQQIDPESEDTEFEDQTADITITKSVPYRLFKLTIEQIPDYMVTILNCIFGCSNVRIDGVAMTKNKEAKIESSFPSHANALKNYTMEMREAVNLDGKTFESSVISNDEITLLTNTDSKGFADTSEEASSSIVTFIDIN